MNTIGPTTPALLPREVTRGPGPAAATVAGPIDRVMVGAGQPPRLNIDPKPLIRRIESFLANLPSIASAPVAGTIGGALQDVLGQANHLLVTNPTYVPMQLISAVAKLDRTSGAKELKAAHLDVPIGNFGVVVKDKLYRGTQPSRAGLQWLAASGVKTVVSLRRPQVEDHYAYVDFKSTEEADECAKVGMRGINIAISDEGLASPEQVEEFLRVMADPANAPVFVHCAAGVGRTGIMCGIYERQQGADIATVNRHLARYQLTPTTDAARRQLDFIANYPVKQADGWQVATR